MGVRGRDGIQISPTRVSGEENWVTGDWEGKATLPQFLFGYV